MTAPPPPQPTTTSAKFDIRKLYHSQKRRDDHRQELYDSMVRKVHHRVETVAQRNETQCLFQIPQFIIGMPLYDPFQCTGYVIHTLKAQGFHVRYFHPNTLHVDWSRHLIEPYVQALDRRSAAVAADTGGSHGGFSVGGNDHGNSSGFSVGGGCDQRTTGTHSNSNDKKTVRFGGVTEVGLDSLDYVPTGKLFG